MQWADGKEWRDSWQKTYKSLWHYTMPAAWKTEDDYPWVIKPKSEKKDVREDIFYVSHPFRLAKVTFHAYQSCVVQL